MNKFIIIGVLCCITLCHTAPANKMSRLVEGDIKIQMGKSLADASNANVWINGVVPYIIDPNVYTSTEISTILAAMDMITSKTGGCITFVPKTSQADYIQIRKLDGCWSYIGRTGGVQELSLGTGCVYKGTSVHEMCHALGFWHEQNRADRDTYVKISFENIQVGMESNFDKYTAGQYFSTPYDYRSIMHYAELSFSKNGLQTITPLQAGIDLIPSYDKTDAQILTAYDIQAIRARYQCTGVVPPTVAPVTVAPITVAPITVAPITVAPTCFDINPKCSYYYNDRATYCDTTKGYAIPGSSYKFFEDCRKMCGLCTVVAGSCTDQWYCPQYTVAYCSTYPISYTVLGTAFVKACPNLCNTCGLKNVALSLPKAFKMV